LEQCCYGVVVHECEEDAGDEAGEDDLEWAHPVFVGDLLDGGAGGDIGLADCSPGGERDGFLS